jgi:TRAP-type C4-dicarboxylate transport system substrate-binding protein
MKKLMVPVLAAALCAVFMVTVLPSGDAHAKVIKLKAANFFPPPSNQSQILEEFCREVEARTGGAVKIDYYAGGSLLKPTAMFDGVVTGIADIGYAHVYYTSGRMPVTEAIGLPLGYPSAWVAGHVANDFYEEFKPKEFDKVKVLLMNTSTPSAIATANKPVRKLEDLKGLTLRAPGIAGEVIKALGATPAPTPMPEVYDAIAKGVLDGEASNFETLATFRFAEVVQYSTSAWQITNPYPFYLVMNKNSYAKLPPDIRSIFDTVVGEYKELYQLRWNAVDFFGRSFGQEKGVSFIDLPDKEAQRWVTAVEPVIDGYVKNMVKKGFSETEVRGDIKFIRNRIGYWRKQQIAFRIPSIAGPPEIRPEALLK